MRRRAAPLAAKRKAFVSRPPPPNDERLGRERVVGKLTWGSGPEGQSGRFLGDDHGPVEPGEGKSCSQPGPRKGQPVLEMMVTSDRTSKAVALLSTGCIDSSAGVRWFLPVLLLLVGCRATSGTDGGAADAGHFTVASDTICPLLAEATCAWWERCGISEPTEHQNCLKERERQCLGAIGNRLAAGALVLDFAAAQTCLDAYPRSRCQGLAVSAGLHGCDWAALVKPNARVGQRCGSQEDCLEGYCRSAVAGACPTCLPRIPTGARCRDSSECEPPHDRCASVQTEDAGFEARCLPGLADRQPCAADEECATGHCYRTTGAGECGWAVVGGTCADGDCAAGDFCRRQTSGAAYGLCAPRIATGAPCTNAPHDDGCADAAATCLDGRCVVVEPGTLTNGAECEVDGQCADGLFCGPPRTDGGTWPGTCRPWLAVAAHCDIAANGCAPGTRCVEGGCRAMGGLGEACTTTGDCRLNLTCPTTSPATCSPLPSAGQACVGWGPCVDSYCDALFEVTTGGTETGTCRPYLGTGAVCGHAVDSSAPYICQSQYSSSAPDGGDFTVCADCLSGQD